MYSKIGVLVKRFCPRGLSPSPFSHSRMKMLKSNKIQAKLLLHCASTAQRLVGGLDPWKENMLWQVSKKVPSYEHLFFNAPVADLNDTPPIDDVRVRAGGIDLGYETDWQRFNKLDCLEWPGLTEVEFFGLFTKCEVCKLVMMREVFPMHYCRQLGEDGLELTDWE